MKRCVTLFAGSALLMLATTAVAGWPNKREPYEPVAIPRDISQGYSLVLLKPFAVASGRKAVYFQGGQLVEEHGIRADSPYCRLELAGPARTEITIQPQDFLVTDVTYDDRAHEAISRLVEAGLGDQEVAAISGHKSTQMLKRYTHLRAEDLVERLDQLMG